MPSSSPRPPHPQPDVERERDGDQPPDQPDQPAKGEDPTPPLPSEPPPPPKPSADKAIHEANAQVIREKEETAGTRGEGVSDTLVSDVDVLGMLPTQALGLLCGYVQLLLQNAGQPVPKPPTPPASNPTSEGNTPAHTPGPEAQGSVTRENERPPLTSPTAQEGQRRQSLAPPDSLTSPAPTSPQHPYLQRVPKASRTPIDSPVSHPQSPIPPSHPASPLPALDKRTHFIAQSDKLARKFYCKSVPPVSLTDYLARLHRYCPMSVAVYLAAGVYIERLTQRRAGDNANGNGGSLLPLTPVSSNSKSPYFDGCETAEEGNGGAPPVDVTPRSVHRLLLAALRVAMKALEDGVFPHRRVALVGGVSELELARLEVSMCFLTDFELVLKLRHMEGWVRRVKALGVLDVDVTTAASGKDPS